MRTVNFIYGGALALFAASLLIGGCNSSTIPESATAVKPFDIKRYTGKWYEIARLDFKQERGLNNTTADYSSTDTDKIKVVNRGYDRAKGEWKEATGKAKFAGATDEAKLKVSFFGPFYSGYNVIAIDDDYRYALVAGESLKYLWLLSRETTMPNNVKQEFLAIARKAGYNTDELLWVEHDKK